MKVSIFKRDRKGGVIIEMAIILPVLILLSLSVIEFGLYFAQYQIASRSVNNTSYSIEMNPTDTSLQSIAQKASMSFVDLAVTPNYVCAKAYTTYAAAVSGLCQSGDWVTTSAGPIYYVAVVVHVKHTPISPLAAWLSDVNVKTVVQVYPSASGGSIQNWTGSQGVLGSAKDKWAAPPGCYSSNDHGFCASGYTEVGVSRCGTGRAAILCQQM